MSIASIFKGAVQEFKQIKKTRKLKINNQDLVSKQKNIRQNLGKDIQKENLTVTGTEPIIRELEARTRELAELKELHRDLEKQKKLQLQDMETKEGGFSDTRSTIRTNADEVNRKLRDKMKELQKQRQIQVTSEKKLAEQPLKISRLENMLNGGKAPEKQVAQWNQQLITEKKIAEQEQEKRDQARDRIRQLSLDIPPLETAARELDSEMIRARKSFGNDVEIHKKNMRTLIKKIGANLKEQNLIKSSMDRLYEKLAEKAELSHSSEEFKEIDFSAAREISMQISENRKSLEKLRHPADKSQRKNFYTALILLAAVITLVAVAVTLALR